MSNKTKLDWNGNTWQDAPEGMRWRAYDEDGEWSWHKKEPREGMLGNYWVRHGGDYIIGGNCGREVPNWRDTLEMRPTKKPQTLHIAKLIGAAVAAGLIELEDVPDDAAAALAHFKNGRQIIIENIKKLEDSSFGRPRTVSILRDDARAIDEIIEAMESGNE